MRGDIDGVGPADRECDVEPDLIAGGTPFVVSFTADEALADAHCTLRTIGFSGSEIADDVDGGVDGATAACSLVVDGNVGAALGCVYGGAAVCAWYPITPSSSLAEAFQKYCEKYRVDPATGKLRANKANHFLQDRGMQRNFSFTGILGTREQDTAVVEGMGAIVDRTQEHLGRSDMVIAHMRRELLQHLREFASSGKAYGLGPKANGEGIDYRSLRATSEVVPSSTDMVDYHNRVLREARAAEQSRRAPPVAAPAGGKDDA